MGLLKDARYAKGLVFLCITVILFSTYEVTCKLIGTRLQPLQISFLRFTAGGLFLLPFAINRIRKRKITVKLSFLADTALLGFVNIVVSMGLIQYGLLYADASASAVIFSSNPIFVALFAALILKEKVGKAKIIGMAAGSFGVVVLFSGRISLSPASAIGLPLVLLSAVFFALYTVLGKRVTLKGADSLIMTSFSFLLGSIMLLPVMLFMHVPVLKFDSEMIPYILYLGILTSGVAYMCYFYGLAHVNTSTGSLIYFVKPALASLISVLVLHETLDLRFYAGTAIILLSLAAVSLKPGLKGKSQSLIE